MFKIEVEYRGGFTEEDFSISEVFKSDLGVYTLMLNCKEKYLDYYSAIGHNRIGSLLSLCFMEYENQVKSATINLYDLDPVEYFDTTDNTAYEVIITPLKYCYQITLVPQSLLCIVPENAIEFEVDRINE